MTLKRRVYMSGEEAAWLADKIVAYGEYGNDAARMLRRLSTIEQQRDDLLAALKEIRNAEWMMSCDWGSSIDRSAILDKTEAAIAKAEGLQE